MRRTTLLLSLFAVTSQLAPAAVAQDAPPEVATPTPSPSPLPSPPPVPPVADTEPPEITIRTRNGRVVLGDLRRIAPIRATFSEPARVTIRVTTASGRRVAPVPTAARLVTRTRARWAGGGVRGRLVKPGSYRFVVRAEDDAGNAAVARTKVRAVAGSYASAARLHYTYVLERRDVTGDAMRDFARIAAATLADMRGWSLRHNIAYRRVASGGHFRLILASPAAVAAASSACSSYWSCRVGSQVLVNVDRWRWATPTWTKSKREYRSYVINHEVGHWLGLGHDTCGGAGRPAPVMMQQSKGTYGCRNNVWPLEHERDRVAQIRPGTEWPLLPLASPCTIVGTGRRDVLKGTRRADVVCGLAGDDVLHGFKGDDILYGGPGRDARHGGPGADRARGRDDACVSCGARAQRTKMAEPQPRRRVDVE